MQPMFMKKDSIDSLLINFDEAKPHYVSNDRDWFEQRLVRERGLRYTRFTFPDFVLTCGAGEATEDEYAATDAENVRIIYDAMHDLPVATAVDQRFWSGLCHTNLWDFIQYRRRKALASGKDLDIKSSYFFMRGVKRSAHVHCVSRLWWAGRLTFDEQNRENPYALTHLLTDNAFASRVMLLSSSNFTANKSITLGILDAIEEQSASGIPLKREHFVGATKYLNRMGAITVLDYLDRKRVRSIISAYFATDEFIRLKV